jgi:uncharacterized protein DUF2490
MLLPRALVLAGRVLGVCLGGLLLLPAQARAQTNGQFWGSITFGLGSGVGASYELELEPKFLVIAPTGEPGWASIDATPNVEYGIMPWLDAVGELATSYTVQTDDLKSFELSPRAGARFHLLSRDMSKRVRLPDRPSKRRLVIRDLVRVESRNVFYNGDTASSFTWRFRNRVEFQVPLTAEKVTDDGARYLTADWEWFMPLGEPDERYANRQRIRAGFGYRRNAVWRFEALYIWGRSRNTADDGFSTSDNIVSFRIKHAF